MEVKFVEIRTSIDNEDEARKIAERLLSKHVVASCHVSSADTYYYWDSKYVQDHEWEVRALTATTHIEIVRNTMFAEHYYDCSEFIVTPIIYTTPQFGKWIMDSIIPLTKK